MSSWASTVTRRGSSRDEIVVYDSVADVRDASTRGRAVFLFASIGWVGVAGPRPDPRRRHAAGRTKCEQENTETPLEKIRVWVDYVSIHHEKSKRSETSHCIAPDLCELRRLLHRRRRPTRRTKSTGCLLRLEILPEPRVVPGRDYELLGQKRHIERVLQHQRWTEAARCE